jgi:hypothetical protein
VQFAELTAQFKMQLLYIYMKRQIAHAMIKPKAMHGVRGMPHSSRKVEFMDGKKVIYLCLKNLNVRA